MDTGKAFFSFVRSCTRQSSRPRVNSILCGGYFQQERISAGRIERKKTKRKNRCGTFGLWYTFYGSRKPGLGGFFFSKIFAVLSHNFLSTKKYLVALWHGSRSAFEKKKFHQISAWQLRFCGVLHACSAVIIITVIPVSLRQFACISTVGIQPPASRLSFDRTTTVRGTKASKLSTALLFTNWGATKAFSKLRQRRQCLSHTHFFTIQYILAPATNRFAPKTPLT
jgi:hypothetical protein